MQYFLTIRCVVLSCVFVLGLVFGSCAIKSNSVYAANFTVNSTADVIDANPGDGICETETGNGICSLRAAILEANTLPGADRIDLPSDTYVLSIPGHEENSSVTGDLDINDDLTIIGIGSSSTIIDGNKLDRVIHISGGVTVELSGITIQNGRIQAGGFFDYEGAGIYNLGSLTLNDVIIKKNEGAFGGGICNSGNLIISDSEVIENGVNNEGCGIENTGNALVSNIRIRLNANSGIRNLFPGNIRLDNVSISENTAWTGGGILNFDGTLTVNNTAIYGNKAGYEGGGIYNSSSETTTLTNTTISSNIAERGAGLQNSVGVIELVNVTIIGNRSSNLGAAGISNFNGGVTLKNVIISDNFWEYGPNNCEGLLFSYGHNIDSHNTCGFNYSGDLINTTPLVGPLQNNGGYTFTHALLSGSPAIDTGDNLSCPEIDQRGEARPLDGNGDGTAVCDIGAYEHKGTIPGEELKIASIFPSIGGNVGNVTIIVQGSGFKEGIRVRLIENGIEILSGMNTRLESSNIIQTTFDLLNQQPQSLWLEVINSDDNSVIASQSFVIEEGGKAEVWAEIIGRNVARIGSDQTFFIIYGNSGNIDASAAYINVELPKNIKAKLEVDAIQYIIDPNMLPANYDLDWIGLQLMHRGLAIGGINLVKLSVRVENNFSINVSSHSTLLSSSVINVEKSSSLYKLDERLSVSENPEKLTMQGALFQKPLSKYNLFKIDESIAKDGFVEHAVISFPEKNLAFTVMPTANGKNQLVSGTISEIEYYLQSRGYEPAKGPNLVYDKNKIEGYIDALSNFMGTEWIPLENPFMIIDIDGQLILGDCISPFEYIAQKTQIFGVEGFFPDSEEYWAYEGDLFSRHFIIDNLQRTIKSIDVLYREQRNYSNQNGLKRELSVETVASKDPNDKLGPIGYGSYGYIKSQNMLYVVNFENQPTATAPAQEVVITDRIDLTKMDLNSFGFGPLTFGKNIITPPPYSRNFSTTVDLRPINNLLVKINADLNKDTGVATWRFASIDPATGQPTEDPLAGFLPPNVNPPEGEGTILFTVMPKPGLMIGSQIENQASIVFDTNEAINTPEWINTIDNYKPQSQVRTLAANQPMDNFQVEWSGNDVGAGVKDYTIFVSEDNGFFRPWLNTTKSSAIFTGENGKTYEFYSIARDHTGNTEDAPSIADTLTKVLLDKDQDGIPDTEDQCMNSNMNNYVVIGTCSTGVKSFLNNGCTMNDLIEKCKISAKNKGAFVSCVATLTEVWKKDNIITGKEKGAINSCAAKAKIQ